MSGLNRKFNYIKFKLHNPTGLINQVMSLEIACAIAAIDDRKIIVHNTINNGDHLFNYKKIPIYTPSRWQTDKSGRSHIISNEQFPHLLNLVDYDPNLQLEFYDSELNVICNDEIEVSLAEINYVNCDGSMVADHFKNGRTELNLQLSHRLSIINTLSWFSYSILNRTPKVNAAISSVKFKNEYMELSKQISDSLSSFSCAHIRLTDHGHMFSVSQEMVDQTIMRLKKFDKPVIVCTDESVHPYFDKHRKNIIMLDRYIVDNFVSEFKSLAFSEEVVFGLLNLLVASKSDYFVGTPGSTYSGYIQRLISQRNPKQMKWCFVDDLDIKQDTSWWDDKAKCAIGRDSWWREWPQCVTT